MLLFGQDATQIIQHGERFILRHEDRAHEIHWDEIEISREDAKK